MVFDSQFLFSQSGGVPKGLKKLGSSCYINSIIQCIRGIQELVPSLSEENCGPVASALLQVLKCLECEGEAEDITYFLDIVAKYWDKYEHQVETDAEEFFTFLLTTLHEELKTVSTVMDVAGDNLVENIVKKWISHNTSVISNIFSIQIVTLLMCPQCSHSSGQYDDINNHLSIELPVCNRTPTLEDCLLAFSQEQDLGEAVCSKCSGVGMKHRLILGRLPTILVIHLERFKQHYNGSLKKVCNYVSLPAHLELAPYTVQLLQSSTSYNLFGVTNHHGRLIYNGHYTSICRRGDRWYRFDDSRVSNVTSRNLGSDSAYLVWYHLKEDIQGDLPLDNNPIPTRPDSHSMTCESPHHVCTPHSMTCESPHHGSDKEGNCGSSSEECVPLPDETDDEMDDLFAMSEEDGETVDPHHAVTALSKLTIQDKPQSADAFPLVHPSQQLCNHPVYDLDVMDPQLSENEVPGAKVNSDELEKYNKKELVRWLQCRRLTTGGNKPELRERIRHHINNNKESKIYQGIDSGKWYEIKRKRLMEEAHKSNQKALPMMPVGNKVYQPFPSVHIPNNFSSAQARDYLDLIPDIRFSYEGGVQCAEGDANEEEIVDFSQPTQEDRKNIFVHGTLKRANNFIDSGRVLGITDCIRNEHYFVKADVRASFRDVIYKISIMIAKKSGSVCFAECCCKARALGRCCHIMAVLLLIGQHGESKGHEAITCTGRLCYWLAPGSSTHRQPGVIREKNEYYKNSENFKRRGHFDPRPTVHQIDTDNERVLALRTELSGMVTKLLWHYQLLESPTSQTSQYPDVDLTQEIAEICSLLHWNLNSIRKCSTTQPVHLIRTGGQSGSDYWHSERSVRISASVAKVFLGLSSDKSRMNFMKKHMWRIKPFCNEAMNRGNELEGVARDAYRLHLQESSLDIEIFESGAWVNPAHPQLSCSPDGLIVDSNGIVRLLEIKCPEVLTEMDPNNFEQLPKGQLSRFCIRRIKQSKELELKSSHKWYLQVQMSLAIISLEYCDFVVFSTVKGKPKFMKVEVKLDKEFWNEKQERLIRIHREWIVPEHFLANTAFNRLPMRLVYTPFHEEHNDDYFLEGSFIPEAYHCALIETEDAFLIRSSEDSQIQN